MNNNLLKNNSSSVVLFNCMLCERVLLESVGRSFLLPEIVYLLFQLLSYQ